MSRILSFIVALLVAITSATGESLTYEHDGNIVVRTVSAGTVNASVEHELDENFRVIRETVDGAWPVDFAYDVDGLLTQAGPVVITRDFATGFVTNTTIYGVTAATTYDDYGDRETYTASFGGTVLYSEAHERDDIGRITKTTEVVEGVTKVWEYAYDLDGRLAEAYVHRPRSRQTDPQTSEPPDEPPDRPKDGDCCTESGVQGHRLICADSCLLPLGVYSAVDGSESPERGTRLETGRRIREQVLCADADVRLTAFGADVCLVVAATRTLFRRPV